MSRLDIKLYTSSLSNPNIDIRTETIYHCLKIFLRGTNIHLLMRSTKLQDLDPSQPPEGQLMPLHQYLTHSQEGSLQHATTTFFVGIRNAQIPLMLKLRKDRRTKFLLLLKLGIKVCRIITESYRHLILYKRR
jgi:hypothetical protein